MPEVDKVACIAGGTSGIGRALSEQLLKDGWTVYAVGLNAEHAAKFTDEAGADAGNRLHVRYGDLRDIGLCREFAAEIRNQFSRLDLLVNSAGTIGAGGIREENAERWNLVVSSNLTPVFNMTKVFLDLLAGTDDSNLINVSSVCSLSPCGSVAYSVSKAGLDMFTKSAARELAPYGIRVNSVNPSVVSAATFRRVLAFSTMTQLTKLGSTR